MRVLELSQMRKVVACGKPFFWTQKSSGISENKRLEGFLNHHCFLGALQGLGKV